MLNRGQLIARLVELGAGDRKHVDNMLKRLADVAAEEIEAGNDFTVPGVVKLSYTYTAPRKKGEAYRKGDTVIGVAGSSSRVAEVDSPARKARIKLRAVPVSPVSKLKPGSKPEAQAAFLKSKVGRAIAARKRVR